MLKDYMGGLVNSRTREGTIENKEDQGVKEWMCPAEEWQYGM